MKVPSNEELQRINKELQEFRKRELTKIYVKILKKILDSEKDTSSTGTIRTPML